MAGRVRCVNAGSGDVNPILECPHPYLVRNVPFLCFRIWLFLLCSVSGGGWSGTLRRSLCGAFRVQRRPPPETAAMASALPTPAAACW